MVQQRYIQNIGRLTKDLENYLTEVHTLSHMLCLCVCVRVCTYRACPHVVSAVLHSVSVSETERERDGRDAAGAGLTRVWMG
jgi:hypothetical protein